MQRKEREYFCRNGYLGVRDDLVGNGGKSERKRGEVYETDAKRVSPRHLER